jgi:predicted restriction endonuclease
MELFDKTYEEIKNIGVTNVEKYFKHCDQSNVPLEMLLFIVYDIYKYVPSNKTLEQKLKRQYQKQFRNKLEKKYGCCVITGDDLEMCEACHIIPFADSDVTQMYDINNGLLLSCSLHKLFDKHLMTIDEYGMVILSQSVLSKRSYQNYHKYHKMKLHLNKFTLNNLHKHHSKFMELNKNSL